MGHPITDLR